MKKASSTSKLPNYVQFDTISPATKLLEKRRKMYEVHEAFEAQKDEFKKQEEVFKRQEEEIKERDLGIQENLIKFCKFLSENEQKQKRADKRLEDEQKACAQKDSEISELNSHISELVKLHNKLEQKLNQLKQYEEYLEKVQKLYSDQYNDKGDILTRYKTLISSNIKLQKNHADLETMLETLKAESNHFEKEKNNEIIQLNNDIKDLLKKKEEKETERNSLVTQIEQKSSEASSKTMNLGKILMAIDNLYLRCSADEIAKIRYDFEDYRKKQQFFKKGLSKKEKKEREEMLRKRKNENTENYKAKAQKGEISVAKLKAIICYLVDFEKLRQSAVEVSKSKKHKE